MGRLFVCLELYSVIRSVFGMHLVEQMASVLEGKRLDRTKRCLDCGRLSINWEDLVGLPAVLMNAKEAPITIDSKLN